jgi:hypothetical protein
LELLNRLNQIPGVSLPLDSISRRPGFSLSLLAKEESLAQFLNACDWVIEQFRSV